MLCGCCCLQHLPALQMRQLDFLLQHLGGAPPNTPASAAQ
jgi:hypothetical protein